MKIINRIFLLSIIIIMSVSSANGALKKLAQTGFQYLKIDVSPRAAAMGGSFIMIEGDPANMFYNPAGIAKIDKSIDVFAARTNWIADVAINAAGIVSNLGNVGTFGVSFVAPDYGTIYGTRVSDNAQGFVETGNVDVGAYTIGISYARQLSAKFSVGGQAKYNYQHLGSNMLIDGSTIKNEVSGMAFDLGTIFYPGWTPSFRLGMSIRNFSQQLKYQQEGFEMPLTFRLGVAMNIFDFIGAGDMNPLLISVDALHPRDYTERVHIGAEYSLLDMFAVRAGYKTNYDEEGLSAGIGFQQTLADVQLSIDYSWSDFGLFQSVNRFALNVAF